MRRCLIFLSVFLLILLAGCSEAGGAGGIPTEAPTETPLVQPVETPAELPIEIPAEEGGGEPVLERFGLDPEEIEEITYSANHFGSRTLKRGEEGFDRALALLAALRGEPVKAPKGAVSRQLRIKLKEKQTTLSLEWDGERVYAALNYFDYLLLDGTGRPDDGLEAIIARYAPPPDRDLPPFDADAYTEDGQLVLEAERRVYDRGALLAAIEGSLARFREPGPAEGTRGEAGAVVRLRAENRGGEPISYGRPVLQVFRDGEWYPVPLRMSLGDDLLPRYLGAGETLVTGVSMFIYDDPLEPGLYRACMFYSPGGELKTVRDHAAFAEFFIGEG